MTQFVTGGALGFDTLAAEEVLCQRKTHPNIRLHLMMPCKGQEKKWRLGDRMRYQRITRQADEVTCLAEEYYDGCMLKRNRGDDQHQRPLCGLLHQAQRRHSVYRQPSGTGGLTYDLPDAEMTACAKKAEKRRA